MILNKIGKIKKALINLLRFYLDPKNLKKLENIDNQFDKLNYKLNVMQDKLESLQKVCNNLDQREIETVKAICLRLLASINKCQKIRIKSDYKIAYTSPDHIFPHGTKNDNSKYYNFNTKLYSFMKKNMLKVLDLGCAGGVLFNQ